MVDDADAADWAEPGLSLEGVPPQERARLLGRHGRQIAAGTAVFDEGAPAEEAYPLETGRVRLLKRVGMTDRSLAVLKDGDLFGEGALVEGMTYGSTAIALSDCVVLALDRATFRALIGNQPAIAAHVIEQLVRRVRDAEDQIEILMIRGVQSKVTSALIKLAGRSSGPAEVVISPVELSVRVGLDVDAVKRTIQRLRDRQYVVIRGERIEIPEVEALQRLLSLLGAKDELSGPD